MNYCEIKECLLYLKKLEERKKLLYVFYQELLTCRKTIYTSTAELKYLRFKHEYLIEIANAQALREQQIYLETINKRNYELLREVAQ